MKSILSIISPITLCINHQKDTAQTGKGCLLDICSYLNGDAIITDKTPCVDDMIRPIAMMVNDFSTAGARQELLSLVPRLMVSANPTPEQASQRERVMYMFREYQESATVKIREIIDLEYAPYEYAAYLREKLMAKSSVTRSSWAYQTMCQYGRAMLYLEAAAVDAIIRNRQDFLGYIDATLVDMRTRALRCLTDMLPKEELIETPTHLGRAQQLVDTKLRHLPV